MSKQNEFEESSSLEWLVVGLIAILQIPAAVYFGSWVDLSIFNWFLANVQGVPHMTLLGFIGLNLLASGYIAAVAWSVGAKKDETETQNKKNAWYFLISNLGFAWGFNALMYVIGYSYYWWFVIRK